MKNPIGLARTILVDATSPAFAHSCPPNLLCGYQAVKYAQRRRLVVVPNTELVSPSAGDRFNRWLAESRRLQESLGVNHESNDVGEVVNPEPEETEDDDTEMTTDDDETVSLTTEGSRPGASDKIEANVSQESARASAAPRSTRPVQGIFQSPTIPIPEARNAQLDPMVVPDTPVRPSLPTALSVADTPTTRDLAQSALRNPIDGVRRLLGQRSDYDFVPPRGAVTTLDQQTILNPASSPGQLDGRYDDNAINSQDGATAQPQTSGLADQSSDSQIPTNPSTSTATPTSTSEDHITDTVGAIAVDRYGNIAAGSSSGGIGMKVPGRIGPAALIGIGTHVMPVTHNDPEAMSVAAVTSGTGEHIASTAAARVCCELLYDTRHHDAWHDHDAIKYTVEHKFIRHPAVLHSHTNPSLGVMAVKKSTAGIKLYFAHNTHSFALASFTSIDRRPNLVMSRKPDGVLVAQGGRSCIIRAEGNASASPSPAPSSSASDAA